MKSRSMAVAAALLAGLLLVPAAKASADYDSALELEAHFLEHGLEPLPGQASMRVKGGVVGVFRGSPAKSESRPYVLVIASPPAGMESVGVLVEVGRDGVSYNGLPLPAMLASPGRHVIVAYWEDPETTGEGILPLEQVAAYLDLSAFDGRGARRIEVSATASSPVWLRLIEQSNIPLGLDLEIRDAPDLASPRARAFYGREIPGLQLANAPSSMPGAGTTPAYVPAATLATMIAAKVSRLGEPPPFQRVDRDADAGTPKARKPYTGTIPDYTADVEGLLLEGVLEGGPAEEAGLEAGDVIVELAGRAISDVYTYADVLDTLEVDQAVKVVFLRDGERHATTMTIRGR